ncbi:hypothetical protein H257_00964 [Aphanomyces astaci]|uniref:Uncharacterized protein n=1 Tax=Aphanomyces astaci TaxID=112090 RepID=W4H5R9_APHAT|nr:hypothetical protein H257_00964 [Aphanomyces astaci]ETV87365.1 hypothetical protein H257_00964 [Aphanomyces astaci]|eukprot:XP_009822228.1 hypothetical protein H257_00964 [Aphanomyces astaci]
MSLCSARAEGFPSTSTMAAKPPAAVILAACLDRCAIPKSISKADVDPWSNFRAAWSSSGTFAAADSDKVSFRLASSATFGASAPVECRRRCLVVESSTRVSWSMATDVTMLFRRGTLSMAGRGDIGGCSVGAYRSALKS